MPVRTGLCPQQHVLSGYSELTCSSMVKVHLSLRWLEHSKPRAVFGFQYLKNTHFWTHYSDHPTCLKAEIILSQATLNWSTWQCLSHGKCFTNFVDTTVFWGPWGNGEEAMGKKDLQWRLTWLNGWLHTHQEATRPLLPPHFQQRQWKKCWLLIGREHCMRNRSINSLPSVMATLGSNHSLPCTKRD